MQAEFAASYLPSFLRTALDVQIEPITSYILSLGVLLYCTSVFVMLDKATYLSRFVRVCPEEALRLHSLVRDRLVWFNYRKVS